jgi:hypothetical protein
MHQNCTTGPPTGILSQTKRIQDCLRHLDEVFALGLDATVAMAQVQASGRQLHGVAKINNSQ